MRTDQPQPGERKEPAIWSGRRLSVLGTALGGHLPATSYRLTASWLSWTSGRPRARAERAATWAIRDARVQQSLTQRARRVGDVVVSLQHRDYTGTPTFVVLRDVEHPRQAADLITDAARAARRSHDAHNRQ